MTNEDGKTDPNDGVPVEDENKPAQENGVAEPNDNPLDDGEGEGSEHDNGAPVEDDTEPNPLEEPSDDGEGKKSTDPSNDKTEITDEQWIKNAGLDAEGLENIPCGKNAYGEDVFVTAEEQRLLAPYLRKAGVTAESAKNVLGVLAKIVNARTELENAEYKKSIKRMADEQKAYFGEDFKRVAKEARIGLRRVFQNEYAQLLSKIPELGYSKDFLAGMAKIGRMFSDDDGTGGSASAEMNQDAWSMERWLAHDSKK